ncbi:hypothetical protein GCM10022631_38900 [Deinococcus rubellus]|uniref:Transmembrane protein n=1 Tax=Deinococcus rubellus TaxID=1889240 RepID=A0ABY5YG01_9DEIO|nr:hypothetical protein [Deinococcus rubellus]UWX63027.1 hypothetical protein N0D28_09655 [Deinococcus rubellus]
MKSSPLHLRLLGALVLTAIILVGHRWDGQSLVDVPRWGWGALTLAVVVLLTQWPQRSNLAALRHVPLGWRVGMTTGLFMFLFTLANHASPRPDWFFALFMGLTMGLLFGYIWNQRHAFKSSHP